MYLHSNIRWGARVILWSILATGPAAVGQGAPVCQVLVVSEKGTAVRSGDAVAIRRLAVRQGKNPWLIQLGKAWFAAPPARRCEVYLSPATEGKRWRRGEFLGGSSFEGLRGKIRWELDTRSYAYAQVPLPGRCFGPRRTAPGRRDGPFIVTGAISARDIVETVDLVRTDRPTGPRSRQVRCSVAKAPAAGGEMAVDVNLFRRAAVDHALPISGLDAKDADHVQITTRTGQGSGQQIELQRENGRWEIKQVWQWIA